MQKLYKVEVATGKLVGVFSTRAMANVAISKCVRLMDRTANTRGKILEIHHVDYTITEIELNTFETNMQINTSLQNGTLDIIEIEHSEWFISKDTNKAYNMAKITGE